MRVRLIFALLAAAFIASGCYSSASEYEALQRNAKVIDAQISSKNCKNHGAVYYEFSLEGKHHHGRIPPGVVSCESARAGDRLTVYYDPNHPEVHTPLTPVEAYSREKGFHFPGWALVIVAIHVILGIEIWKNIKRKKP